MAERQSCVYLLLKQSVTFPETYPEYVHAYREPGEATKVARTFNDTERWFVQQGFAGNEEFRFFVRTVWL